MEAAKVLVVGAGQAGLALSQELTARGVEHLILERGRVGQSWRDRWDSFCLVTPNWAIQLPGGTYDGTDPDGYLLRDQIVEFFERYAARIGAPVREGVTVTSVVPEPVDGFRVGTASRFSTVMYAGGFRPAYRDWLPIDGAFDDLGFPIHVDGESVVVAGLHFIGVHFLRKRKSSLLIGVGEDAAIVADRMAGAT